MSHQVAKRVFREVRDRPYAWALSPGSHTNNCYVKGVELLQRLGMLGYTVRGRVGENSFDRRLPERIRRLHPGEFLLTHFWVEVLLDEQWLILDASYDSALSHAGFPVREWGDNAPCFNINRVYTQPEAISHQMKWSDEVFLRRYYAAIAAFAHALNHWYESARSCPGQVAAEGHKDDLRPSAEVDLLL
ncbi:MAG: hypothetical protein AAFX65_13705 [Cyanobacteria bacterium J06638_7]